MRGKSGSSVGTVTEQQAGHKLGSISCRNTNWNFRSSETWCCVVEQLVVTSNNCCVSIQGQSVFLYCLTLQMTCSPNNSVTSHTTSTAVTISNNADILSPPALRLMKRLHQCIPRFFLQVWSTKGIKLTINIHLVLWLWTSGAVPPLPHVFIVWYLINHKYNVILIECHNKRLCITTAAGTARKLLRTITGETCVMERQQQTTLIISTTVFRQGAGIAQSI